jgi:hypothetical protein
MHQDAPPGPLTLMRQFLDLVAESPRDHAGTMEAWRTSCPRLSAWEDALEAGLIRFSGERVVLTEAGERTRRG